MTDSVRVDNSAGDATVGELVSPLSKEKGFSIAGELVVVGEFMVVVAVYMVYIGSIIKAQSAGFDLCDPDSKL